jgi:hypothetical protein
MQTEIQIHNNPNIKQNVNNYTTSGEAHQYYKKSIILNDIKEAQMMIQLKGQKDLLNIVLLQ